MKLMIGSAGAVYNDSLFFCPVQFNALCKTELKTGKTEVIGYFETETKDERLYKKAYVYNEFIWFVPWKASRIVCVNLNTLEKEYYDSPYQNISNIGREIEKCAYLSSGIYEGRYLFLVPTMYDTPIIIDMKKRKMRCFSGVLDVKKQAYGYGVIYNDEFWMTPHTGTSLIRLNIDTGSIIEMPWPYNSLEYRGMCAWDNKIWFSPGTKAKSILCYNIQDSAFQHISLGELYNVKDSYNECIVYENGIIFLPYESNLVLFISKQNNKYIVSSLEREQRFFALRRLGISNRILIVEENNNQIYELICDNSMNQICRISIESYEKGKIMLFSEMNEIITEGKYQIEDFVEYVKNR